MWQDIAEKANHIQGDTFMEGSIGFVILHYNAIKETADCVASIVSRIDTDNYHIVIVDNHSPNGTGPELQDMYKDSSKVEVILNDDNLGFARGNNVGYRYMRDRLACDFICIMNNDTLIIQDDFYNVITEEYEQSKFGIMGPRVKLKDGRDNHLYVKLPDREFLTDELKLQRRTLFQMKWHLDHFVTAYKMCRNFINKCLKRPYVSRYREYFIHDGTDIRHEDIVLHGCCLVFSPVYIKEYEDAFNPNTFVYREEDLLYLRCKKKNMGIVYNPKLLIRHLEDVSTDTIVRKNRDKIKFQLSNQAKSLKVLLEEMDKME